MNKITFPLNAESKGQALSDLQDALLHLLEHAIIPQANEEARREASDALKIERDKLSYGTTTFKLVKQFQEAQHLQLTKWGWVDEATAKEINACLREIGVLFSNVVSGRLMDAHKKGLSQYTIILSEYDLDSMTEIKRASSNADGAFEFGFNYSETLPQGDANTAPDLIFQVQDAAGKQQSIMSIFILNSEEEIAVSRLSESKLAPIVLMNAPTDITLRIVVDLQQRPLTEFEELIARLAPYIKQESIIDLKEDETNFQISFLSKECGIDKKKIEQLRDAFEQEKVVKSVPAWAFFGLASQGLALAQVALMSVDELVANLQALQPDFDKSDLKLLAANLQQLAQNQNIQTQITHLKTSVGELILPILVSEENQPISVAEQKLHTFLDAYVRHEGKIEKFWSDISEDPAFQKDVPKIQLNLQLSHLTLNNTGLINALQQQNKITNTRQLVDISSETWEELALTHKAGIPSHITGKDEERAKLYAQELQTLVELAFPTEVVKKTIQQAEVKTFLNNNPDFDITRNPVDVYLLEKGQQALRELNQPEEMKTRLREMQRIYTITANAADMTILLDKKYVSAHQISKLSAEDFARSLNDKIPKENAYIYHVNAAAVSNAAAMLFTQLRDYVAPHHPGAIGTLKKQLGDLSELQKIIPDWESLFGSLDMCECQHCKSVYSPAAYFVDLLHILLGQDDGAARKEIFRRRPDLMYTKLSCEHTETLIPYIDLVNEILETYVAQDDVGDTLARDHAKVSTNDTSDFTASELAANPQHPNPYAAEDAKTAYSLLQRATFPLNLPFDMNLETMRQFLQEQNSSRFEVMQTFGYASPHATAAERLGISVREFEILTLMTLDEKPAAEVDVTKNLWGISTVPAGKTLGELLAPVDTFLDSANIAYVDLLSLLKTYFLNPYFPIVTYLQTLSDADRTAWLAAHPAEDQLALQAIGLKDPAVDTNKNAYDEDSSCDLSKIEIRHRNGTFLSNAELSRFNRFIRLWKKLGCTISELDGMLMSIGATDITPQVIEDLSGLWQVKQYLNLSFEQVAVLIGNISTFGEDSLFARLFLNKAILQIDNKFKLNITQTELESAGYSLELRYTVSPPDEEIKQNKLYLYLEQNKLNYAVKVANKIERIKIDDNELGSHLSSIKEILSDTEKTKQLILEDRTALFTITSKQGYQPPELLREHVPAIIAALQIAEEGFNQIAGYVKLNLEEAPLSLVNLSTLFRYVIFAKGLSMSIEDLMAWLNLTSLSPWKTVTDLVATQDKFTKLQRYRFKASDFAYIFQNEKARGNTLPPKDEVITQSAKTLREGLLKISQENTPKDELITADFLKTELGILLQPEEVDKIIGILEGSNTQLTFGYLLNPKVADQYKDFPEIANQYKDILQGYLTEQDLIELQNFLEEECNLYLASEEKDIKPETIAGNAVILAGKNPTRTAYFVKDKKFIVKDSKNLIAEIYLDSEEQTALNSVQGNLQQLVKIERNSITNQVLNIFKKAIAKGGCFSPDVPARLGVYWEKIEAKLLPFLRKTFVQQHLVATFKADAGLVAFMLQDGAVLNDCLTMETDTSSSAQAYANQYISMYKCFWLIEKLKLSAKELTYFQENANSFDSFNWKEFKFAAWLRIADYVALRDTLPLAEKDLLSVFKTAKYGDISKVADAICDVTAWNKANVEHFVNKLNTVQSLNEITLIFLQKQIALSRQIGVSIAKLESWATSNITFDQAQDIKRSLKAKYDETAWVEVSTQIHNRLRVRLRDALVAYLLQKLKIKDVLRPFGLKNDTNALYSYFLIDVEMDACMLTSRLKQAIASVQLFVQRCLLNLESVITPEMINKKYWYWMQNYGLWEANRKVLLYPENWIEPELRDNKSPFFKELESELLQGEITNESVEQALMHYLEKLHEVARLDICGIYEDKEDQELHFFGRTFSTPSQYFYRKLDLKTQVWTPWEKVQVDIQGNEEGDSAGVHLIPVVWNRRLYLFWPIFTEKSDRTLIAKDKENYELLHACWQSMVEIWKATVEIIKKENEEIDKKNKEIDRINQDGSGRSYFHEPTKPYPPQPIEPKEEIYPWAYYEVRLAWSEYTNKKWTRKKVSQSFIRTPSEPFGVAAIHLYRFSLNLDSTLTIKLFYHRNMLFMGKYVLDCNGKVSVFSDDTIQPLQIGVINPKQINFYQGFLSAEQDYRGIIWHDEDSIPLKLQSNNGANKDILSDSKGEYKVLFSADHNFDDNTSSRFIYQDQEKNYYVEPRISYSVISGLQDPRKVHLSSINDKKLDQPIKPIDKGDPSPFDLIAKFKQFSTEISQVIDDGQIETATALQIRTLQTLAEPTFDQKGMKDLSLRAAKVQQYYSKNLTAKKLQFKPLFHAYVCDLMEALDKNSVEGLLNIFNQEFSDLKILFSPGGSTGVSIPTGSTCNFKKFYHPDEDNVAQSYPIENVDFSPAGAYSIYNWELFFHVPMLLANRLSKNQRFEEAMRWYHFIFNPTTNEKLNSSVRYWQVIPFRNTPKETLESLLKQLQKPAGDPKRKELEDAISAWRDNPFNPHLIARMRLIAYQKNTVMKYLDNLIAWADYLFRQDTIESINQATQLYILAAELLGKRPEAIPAHGKIQAFNYAELEEKSQGLDELSNAQVRFETIFPFFNLQAVQQGVSSAEPVLNTIVPSQYFSLPNNDKLLGYWDTIADRLFKIRHCQNIEGIERQLALFEPPIDPALLVRAVAGGVDISSVLADLNSPLPYYRFHYIVQKALEICSELKSLGSSLLSALEKKDGESLSIMRTQHETLLLNLARTVKKLQTTEAQRSREGLEKTHAVTEHRADFYAQLLKAGLNSNEKEYQTLSLASMGFSLLGQFFESAASSAAPVPDTYAGGLMGGQSAGPIKLEHTGGGTKTGTALSAAGRFFNMLSTMTNYAASAAQTNAGYQRRADDWKLQQDLAKKELAQIDKQILAAQIREKIADQELINHEQQIENARQVEDFLRNKYAPEELYGWMMGEISTIYFQCYQLAYDLAKKAEKAYRYELGLPDSNFVQFGIWDSFRKGLMSGERLYLSLKQMEKSYMDQNRREYEITKNISLLLHDPMALIALKENGSCIVELPEALFDIDYPGHYMRRIKSVSLSIPCVVGPYTSINCTLTLLRSVTRVKSVTTDTYNNSGTGDNRFVTNFAAMQSIATSHGQNDSGLFELNFRDERYLPFEGSGVISRWQIELPKDFRQFEYDTISDVVLHLKYTSREGGKELRKAAVASLKQLQQAGQDSQQARLFSLRHEFPNEWHRLLNVADDNGNHSQVFSLAKQRFPFVFQGGTITVKKVELFGNLKATEANTEIASLKLEAKITLTSPIVGQSAQLKGESVQLKLAEPIGHLVHITANQVKNANSVLVDMAVIVKNPEPDKMNAADWTIQISEPVATKPEDSVVTQLEDILILCHYSVDE